MAETAATPAGAEQAIRRNYRFNFIVNALDGATYWFGYSFISPLIILPLYVSHFTDNPVIIGLLPFLSTAGFLVPQLFTSNFVARAPVKKWFPVTLGFFGERVPVLLFPLTVLLFAKERPELALLTFFLLYAWYMVGAGLIIVGWQDMVAKIIPVDHRGRFFGITNFVGNASGILGAGAVGWVLANYAFPQGFLFAFTAAAALVLLSWFFISLTREPAVPSSKPRVSQLEFLRSLPRVLREDANFSRYLVFQVLSAVSLMASGFLIVYAKETWNMPDSLAGGFIVALQVGQSAGNLLFGFISDRKGHKLILEMCILLGVASLALSIAAGSPLWFYAIFFLRGMMLAGNMLSGISIAMEFSSVEDRPTYIGMANTLPGVASALAPLFGGWLAGVAGYPLMFGLSAVAGLAGFVLLRWVVREPRFAPPPAALSGQSAPPARP
jgi:MFS family permease